MASKKQLLERIEKLEHIVLQVTKPTIEHRRVKGFGYDFYRRAIPCFVVEHEITLKGEVEAIKEHLGIGIEYVAAKTTPAKIKTYSMASVNPVSKKTTKKGKK